MSAAENIAEIGGGVKNLAIGVAVLGGIALVVYGGFKLKGLIDEIRKFFSDTAGKVGKATAAVSKFSGDYNTALMDPGAAALPSSYIGALTGQGETPPASADRNDGVPAQPYAGIFSYTSPSSVPGVPAPAPTVPAQDRLIVPIPGADDFSLYH